MGSVIYVIDYGAGNIRSVLNSCRFLSCPTELTDDPAEVLTADGVILPGVGSFGAAAEALKRTGLDRAVVEAVRRGIPVMGICLGLQLLFRESEESPGAKGLGLLDGEVTRLKCGDRKLPHIGWTSLDAAGGMLDGMTGEYFYFVHSYGAHTDTAVSAAHATYGERFDAAVEKDNLFATQFHPEKSGQAGLALLKRFLMKTGAIV